MERDWFSIQWPHSTGGDRSQALAIKAIWTPPLSQVGSITSEEREQLNQGLGFDLEQAVQTALLAVLGDPEIDHLEAEKEFRGSAAEGMTSEFFVTLWESLDAIPSYLSGLADAYVLVEVLGRVKKAFKDRQDWKDTGGAEVELSFTPEVIASACEWRTRTIYGAEGPFERIIEILERDESINSGEPSARLQYRVTLVGDHSYHYQVDATGTIHRHSVDERPTELREQHKTVIPDVDEWPVQKPLTRDWETGTVERRWPSQDNVDRSKHIAIIAKLSAEVSKPGEGIKDWDFVNRAGELTQLVQGQLQDAIRKAASEVLQGDELKNLGAEHYQVGPAAGGLIGIENYIVTLWESREVLPPIVGNLSEGWVVYEIASRAKKLLKTWINQFEDSRLGIVISFPPAVLESLCTEHVRRNYHPRAKLKSEWHCLTQEFYGGYVSPGHPTESVEYLVLVSTSKKTYQFRLFGDARVTTHSVKEGRVENALPLPDLLEESGSGDLN